MGLWKYYLERLTEGTDLPLKWVAFSRSGPDIKMSERKGNLLLSDSVHSLLLRASIFYAHDATKMQAFNFFGLPMWPEDKPLKRNLLDFYHQIGQQRRRYPASQAEKSVNFQSTLCDNKHCWTNQIVSYKQI